MHIYRLLNIQKNNNNQNASLYEEAGTTKLCTNPCIPLNFMADQLNLRMEFLLSRLELS